MTKVKEKTQFEKEMDKIFDEDPRLFARLYLDLGKKK